MEFVETPNFWCLHIDRAACTNFSPRTIELRPSESREILPFPFLLSHFPFFSLYALFSFLFLSSFFFSFLFAFLFFFSLLILFPFHFLLSLCIFSSFLEHTTHPVKGGNFLPFSSNHLCGHQFSFFFFYFLFPFFMTSSPTWLHVSHGIHFPHMANCEPFF